MFQLVDGCELRFTCQHVFVPPFRVHYYTPCARTTKIASQIAANPEITYLRSRPRPQDLLLDQTSEEWCKSHAEPAGSVVGKESSGVKLCNASATRAGLASPSFCATPESTKMSRA